MEKGKLTTVVVYAKMCRGELTRFIIKNRIENPGDLKGFNGKDSVLMPDTAQIPTIFLAFFHKKILNSQPTQTFYQHSCYLVEFGKINLDNN